MKKSWTAAGATLIGIAMSIATATAAILTETILTGLDSPVLVTHAGDGSHRLFVVEQPGRIKVLTPGSTAPRVFLDISAKVLAGGERGLLGLAFHPRYELNRRFFVNYKRQTDGATVIAEYRTSATDPNVAETNETVMLIVPQPFSNHNGGMIEFGPDQFLYIGMGDGGSANDPGNRAQNINSLLGKILRIDIDRPTSLLPYSSPSTNPFYGAIAGLDEIYAFGLRNPWRFSFDSLTGVLYAGDVGQSQIEEIDVISSGGNYGWRVYEGTRCTGNDPQACVASNYLLPVAEYAHTLGRCSVTGGYVYRGARAALPTGSYVYADYCSGELFLLDQGASSVLLDTPLLISSFGADESGELYIASLSGVIQRIARSPAPAPCSYTTTPVTQTFSQAGGAGNLSITASANDCRWTAASNVNWISITTGTSAPGNGTLGYSVKENLSGSPRQGTLQVAGHTVTIQQDSTSGPLITGVWAGSATPGPFAFVLGANFVFGETQVRLNGVNVPLVQVQDPRMLIIVPPSGTTSGPLCVTTPNGEYCYPAFGVPCSQLCVTGFLPNAGKVGSFVIVFGELFPATQIMVSIDGIPAPLLQPLNNELLSFIVPPAAFSGAITLTTSTGARATSLTEFTVIPQFMPWINGV